MIRWIDKGEGSWFVLFGGTWLGLSAGLLWSTQGMLGLVHLDA